MFLFCVIRFTQKITYIYERNYPPSGSYAIRG